MNISVSETTARAGDVNPYRKDSNKNSLVAALVAFIVAPLSVVSFGAGILAFFRGRQQPAVIGEAAAVLALPFVVSGMLVRSVQDYVPNLLSLIDDHSVENILYIIVSQAPFAIPLGLGAAWVYALVRKSSMLEDDAEEFFTRKTPLQLLKMKKNEKEIKEGKADPVNGVVMGIDENEDKFSIRYEDFAMHMFVVGTTGAGKTTTLLVMLEKMIKDGRSVILADLKGDDGLAFIIAALCKKYGRTFHHFSPGAPSTPYSGASDLGRAHWNPMTRGDYDHLSDLLISMQQQGSADAEIYRTIAHEYLKTMFHVMELAGMTTRESGTDTLSQIIDMMNPDALARVASRLPNTEEAARVRADVSNLISRKRDRTFSSAINGISSTVMKLRKSVEGNYLTTPQNGEDYIDINDIAQRGEVALFSLDSSAKGETSKFMANYLIEDLKLLSSELNANPAPQATHVIFDEFSSVSGDNLIGLINKARSAGINITLATQTTDDLKKESEVFINRVLSNVDVLVCMRVNRNEEAEIFSKSFGTEVKRRRTTKYKSERHIFSTSESSRSGEESISEEDGYKVEPDEISALGPGEAWIKIAHRNVLAHVKIIRREGAQTASRDKLNSGKLVAPLTAPEENGDKNTEAPFDDEILSALNSYHQSKDSANDDSIVDTDMDVDMWEWEDVDDAEPEPSVQRHKTSLPTRPQAPGASMPKSPTLPAAVPVKPKPNRNPARRAAQQVVVEETINADDPDILEDWEMW